MTRNKQILGAVCAVAVALPFVGSSDAARFAPPPGLTQYGRVIWNLDALLHDHFGNRLVYENLPQNFPHAPGTFSTVFHGDCCSDPYLYTFKGATGSIFNTYGPTKPPRPMIGISGGEVPLKLEGAYIYCGAHTWLYEHFGNGPANWELRCHA